MIIDRGDPSLRVRKLGGKVRFHCPGRVGDGVARILPDPGDQIPFGRSCLRVIAAFSVEDPPRYRNGKRLGQGSTRAAARREEEITPP